MQDSTPKQTQSIKLCECGCGKPAPIATYTNARRGYAKGQPVTFIRGHRVIRPIAERFWEKVNKRAANECWEWTAATNNRGYGLLTVGSKTDGTHTQVLAHRLSYEIHNGSIPEGMDICHRCDNPPCCNPAHLFPGTAKENHQDMVAKSRHDVSGLPKGWYRNRK